MEVFDGGYTHPAFYYFSAYKKGLKVYPALSLLLGSMPTHFVS